MHWGLPLVSVAEPPVLETGPVLSFVGLQARPGWESSEKLQGSVLSPCTGQELRSEGWYTVCAAGPRTLDMVGAEYLSIHTSSD